MIQVIANYNKEFWFLLAIIFIIIEINITSLFFFFLSTSSICVILVQIFIPNLSYIDQIALFFIFSLLLGLIFYRPLKNSLKNKQTTNYNNIENTTGIVTKRDLIFGYTGEIKWSGTICKAKIDPDFKQDVISLDSHVTVTKIEGNIFYVKKIK